MIPAGFRGEFEVCEPVRKFYVVVSRNGGRHDEGRPAWRHAPAAGGRGGGCPCLRAAPLPRLTSANYARINDGMDQADVVAILEAG